MNGHDLEHQKHINWNNSPEGERFGIEAEQASVKMLSDSGLSLVIQDVMEYSDRYRSIATQELEKRKKK